MNTAPQSQDYVPYRASVRSERARITSDIDALQDGLIEAENRSTLSPGPAYSRTEATLKQRIKVARDKLESFDAKHRVLDAVRDSDAAGIPQSVVDSYIRQAIRN